MSLAISFQDISGIAFEWDSGNPLPLISESTAQVYEANDEQYYSYSTISMQGLSSNYPDALYDLCVHGVTGTLNIGNKNYFGYFSNFITDGDEATSVRWTRGVAYTLEFSTFPGGGTLYDNTSSSTFETMPYDQQYGPAYKVTQTATSAGTHIQKGDDLQACSDLSRSGVHRAFDSVNTWYKKEISQNFGYNSYDFYDLQGSTTFDEITGEFSLSLSWIMKDREGTSYDKPYHITSTTTEKMSSDYRRTFQKTGTVQGLATGVFPTGLSFGSDSCAPIGETFGFSKADRYKHALKGFSTISNTIPDTAGTELLPEDNEWHGGQNFRKANAPPMSKSPAQSQIGYNPYAGTITYDYTYDDQPASEIAGAITESISSKDKKPGSKYEEIQVLGRRHGPIVTKSVTDYEVGVKSITYEGLFARDTTLKKYSFKQSIMEEIDDYVYGFAPDQNTYNVSVVEDKTDLTLTSNKVTRSIVWNYSPCKTNTGDE